MRFPKALPLAFLVVVMWIVSATVIDHPADAGMGVLITLAGLPVYFLWSRMRRT